MRTAAKRDKNEPEIVAFLRAAGCSVQPLNATNVPDLLVGKHGVNYLMEVKTPSGKLSDGQQEWHATWNGQTCVVRSIEDAQCIIEPPRITRPVRPVAPRQAMGARLRLAREHARIRVRDSSFLE